MNPMDQMDQMDQMDPIDSIDQNPKRFCKESCIVYYNKHKSLL